MYKYINNPETNKRVNIYSKLGKKILNSYIIHLIGSAKNDKIKDWDEWLLSVEKHPFFSDTNYKLSEHKTSEGDFGIIFLSETSHKLIKLVLLGEYEFDLGILGYRKAFMDIEDWINECKFSELLSNLNAGPNYYESNILEPDEINLKNFVPPDTKIGIIKLELLENYENLNNIPITDSNKNIICTNIRDKLHIMHENKMGHCDLHYGNILVNKSTYEVKFIDFGQVKISENFLHHNESENFDRVFDNEDACYPEFEKDKFQSHHKIRDICKTSGPTG